ncbi:MAG: LptA/OstA family protein, partial [Thermodesulfobacteriota bacterium]
MPKPTRSIIPLLCALFCLWAAPSLARGSGKGFFLSDAPVEIDADNIRYDRSTDTYYATGDVEITQDSTVLRSEEVV